jgi:putative glycosyltransferase (TIGR04372 family)
MFRIFAYLSPRTLGDFVAYAVLAGSIRELFDDGKLYVYCRDDRPYKQPIVKCIPNAAGTIVLPPEGATIPIDYFDCHFGRPTHQLKFWEQHQLYDTDLILSGNMLNELMLNVIPPITFMPPPDSVAASDQALAALGIDPSRWFATIYWKEDGYAYRKANPVRTIFDPKPYLATIEHIVNNLGGQVVRLGHPTPTELPKIKGVVDLAKVPGSEWMQLYAVARSRFFIASASGPAAYGPAFGVPTANTDQNLCLGVWGPQDYVVTQDVFYDGKWYRQAEAFDEGFLFLEFKPEKKFGLAHNSAQVLRETADEMLKVSADCSGWRPFTARVPAGPRPNAITLPIPRRYRRDLVIPPSRRV